MKKLQIKQKISSVLKRFPHYILVGVIALAIAATLVVLWLVRSSSATNDFNLVRSYPLTPLEEGTFNKPVGMSRDASGNLYVADSGNARIQKFDSDGTFLAQFGTRGAINGSLSKPVDVTIDSSGNIYVANIYGLDFASWQVVKYNSSGTWLATWDGATDINSINAMLAADSNDNIYVYDGNNYNVTKYDSDGNQLNQWALEKPDGWGCGGCSGGIAVDSNDIIYVGNTLGGQNRVDRYDTSGNYLGVWVSGYYVTDISIDTNDELYVAASTDIYKFDVAGTQTGHWGGYAGNTPSDGVFTAAVYGIQVTSGHVWAAETSYFANRLQQFTTTGTFEKAIGAIGDGQLSYVEALNTGVAGFIDVLDFNRTQIFNTSTGEYVSTYAPHASGSGDGTTYWASGVASDSSGNKYIADRGNNRIQKFDSSGNFLIKWGSSGTGDGQFTNMSDIISDSSGNTYVADTSNHRIQKFDSDGNFVTKWATNNYPVDLDFDSNGDILVVSRWGSTVQKFDSSGTDLGDIALENGGYYTLGIAVDSADNIYTMEFNSGIGYVAMYSPTGDRWGQWGEVGAGDLQFSFGTTSSTPDIAIDSNDHIFIADTYNNRVQEYTHDFQLTIDSNVLDDGEVNSAYSDAVEYSGARNNLLFSVSSGSLPDGLVLDTATGAITGTPTTAGNSSFTIQVQDDVYSDTENFTIHISPAQTAPDVTTGTADNIAIESADLHGTTSPRGVTERGFEYGLTTSYGNQAVDSSSISYTYANNFNLTNVGSKILDVTTNIDGYAYAVDYGANKVYKFSKDGTYVETIATSGSADGDVSNPWRIDADGNGNIYVLEQGGNNRLTKYDQSGAFVSKISGFSSAVAMTVDSDDNVYVADSGFGFYGTRIQKFDSSGNLLTTWGAQGSSDGEFDGIKALATDSSNNVYVADENNSRIQKFDSSGNHLATWPSGGGNLQFDGVTGLGFDSQDTLYLERDAIKRYSTDGSYIDTVDTSGNTDGFFWNLESLHVSANDEIFTTQQGQTGFAAADVYRFSGGISSAVSGLNCGTTYHYRAYSTNNVGTSYGDDQTFTTDACPQVSIDTATLPDGQVAEAYSQTIATSGGAGTQLFEVSAGSMPAGLALNSANGEITGTATVAGDFTFTISVTDDYSNATQQYTVTIAPLDNPLDISTLNLPDGTVDEAYAADIDSTNGLGDVTYALSSGSLPTGLTLNQATGEITGTPTVAGNYDIDITASDDYSTDTQNYTFTIAAAPAPVLINITTTTLVNGVVATGYSATISSEDGVGDVSYSVVDGVLPDGLNLSSGGAISGTPTDPGTFQFTVRATDDNGSDDQVLQIVIYPAQEPSEDSSNNDSTDQTTTPTDDTTNPTSPAMYIDTHYLLDGQVGKAYLGQILVKYSSGSLIFTLIDGNLPEGLSLTTTGYISGIPSEAGEYTFSIKAKSDNGSDTEQYTIEVTDDGAETTAGTSASGGSKEEQIAAQTEEISKTNATLADMIESFAKRLNITPKQALYGAPWAIVGVFAVFTAVSISQMLAQAKYYQDTKKRQAVHKKLLSEKATFLSLASHYLRTPFTVIKGGIDLAAKTVSDATKGMRDATEKLGEKINDVIERIENENKK